MKIKIMYSSKIMLINIILEKTISNQNPKRGDATLMKSVGKEKRIPNMKKNC